MDSDGTYTRRTDARSGRAVVAAGLGCMAVLFVVYSRYQDPELLTPGSVEPLLRIAYAFYVMLAAALGAVAYGMYLYHGHKAGQYADGTAAGGLTAVIAAATWNRRSRMIWAATFAAYGVFFALSSGTLVYQPDVGFSEAYGADRIPSGFVAPCCDAPGYMPVIIVYLTEHVGLQVIPINLVLQVTVSYLVALNVSLAAAAAGLPKKGGGAATVGAATGLFIACPTCAGTLLSVFAGTATGLGAAFVITQLQTVFIAVTIPVLLVTPFVIARMIKAAPSGGTCPAAG